jgi:hypothetical protein
MVTLQQADPQAVLISVLESAIQEMTATENPCDETRPLVVLSLKLLDKLVHVRGALKKLETGNMHVHMHAIAHHLTESPTLRKLNREVKYKRRAGAFVFTVGTCGICMAMSRSA